MRTNISIVVAAYVRLSVDEAGKSVSGSIENQISLIKEYCAKRELIVAAVFQDDGWSGGNFERPGFKKLLEFLRKKSANTVITVDLSRLGRNMREASYYAEEYFPEHGIHFFTISDGFDTARENVFAPFQFAMNEVYLRDGSRKVKDVLRSKRENGQYCACPPYGYRKDTKDKHRLAPDEMTAPVVLRIFEQAARGDSSRKIALDLNEDGVIPPLKYRVLYRDEFSEDGAARASDLWNYTTVKRILKNPVYLGHTLLGKSKKVSVKSKKKIPVPKEDWAVRHLECFPVEINRAPYADLLRVPGIGVKSARRILSARRSTKLTFQDLKKLGVVMKRAVYFITCGGRMMYPTKLEEDYIVRNLTDPKERIRFGSDGMSYRQMTLFDDGVFSTGVRQEEVLPAAVGEL